MATIPSRKATFTEEEKRKLVEGTDAQGKPLSEADKMKLSKMHTARTLGADWRERAAERSKIEEPTRAQQTLEERAAINRRMQGSQLPSPLQKDVTKTELDLPGGGKVKFGADTLARMRGFEEEQATQKQAAEQERRKKAIAYGEERKAALKKRYEDELASRGFAPPKTRQEQEAIDMARAEEFRLAQAARMAAEKKEKETLTAYKDYKGAARYARKNKDYARAAEYEELANQEEMKAGGDIRNASLRKRFFQDKESQKLRQEINRRSEERRAAIQKRSTSNPEASSFTPTASATPLAIGSDAPSYQLPYQRPAGPIEQGFGMTTPSMSDYGVDFSSISPYNVGRFALPQIAQSPASQEAFSKLTAKQKDELISEQIRRGLESTGRGIYRGGKAALKAILEGARAIK